MKASVNKLQKNVNPFQQWFGQLLQYFLVDNCTDNYHDFVTIAVAVLNMTATINGKRITETENTNILHIVKN